MIAYPTKKYYNEGATKAGRICRLSPERGDATMIEILTVLLVVFAAMMFVVALIHLVVHIIDTKTDRK